MQRTKITIRIKCPNYLHLDPILYKKFQRNLLDAGFLTNQSGHVTFSSCSDWSKLPA